jgi:hypothetical protein
MASGKTLEFHIPCAEEVRKAFIAWFGVDGYVRSSPIRGHMRVDSSRETGRKTC